MNINFEQLKNTIENGYMTKKECDLIIKLMNRKTDPNIISGTRASNFRLDFPNAISTVKEVVEKIGGVQGKPVGDVYLAYAKHCEELGIQPVKKLIVSKIIRIEYGLESVPVYDRNTGKTVRTYGKDQH